MLFCTCYCILSLWLLCTILCPRQIFSLTLVLVSKNEAGSPQWPRLGLLFPIQALAKLAEQQHPCAAVMAVAQTWGTLLSIAHLHGVLADFCTETAIIPQIVAPGYTRPLFSSSGWLRLLMWFRDTINSLSTEPHGVLLLNFWRQNWPFTPTAFNS